MRKSLFDLYRSVSDLYTARLYEVASNLYRNNTPTSFIKYEILRKMISDSSSGMIDGVLLLEVVEHINRETINAMVYDDYTPDYVGFDSWDWEHVSCMEDLKHDL